MTDTSSKRRKAWTCFTALISTRTGAAWTCTRAFWWTRRKAPENHPEPHSRGKRGKIQGIQPLWKEVFREEQAKKPVSLSIPVKGGQQVRLRVDDGGNGIGSDGFEWSDLRLEGPGGTVPLTKAQQYTVGYGEARYDAKSKIWQAHAVSSLVFDIPKGDWNLKGTGTPRWSASVGVTVQVGGSSALPDAVKKYVKNVTFKIPQLGSYALGFPKIAPRAKR